MVRKELGQIAGRLFANVQEALLVSGQDAERFPRPAAEVLSALEVNVLEDRRDKSSQVRNPVLLFLAAPDLKYTLWLNIFFTDLTLKRF